MSPASLDNKTRTPRLVSSPHSVAVNPIVSDHWGSQRPQSHLVQLLNLVSEAATSDRKSVQPLIPVHPEGEVLSSASYFITIIQASGAYRKGLLFDQLLPHQRLKNRIPDRSIPHHLLSHIKVGLIFYAKQAPLQACHQQHLLLRQSPWALNEHHPGMHSWPRRIHPQETVVPRSRPPLRPAPSTLNPNPPPSTEESFTKRRNWQ